MLPPDAQILNTPTVVQADVPAEAVERFLAHFIYAFKNLDWESFRLCFTDDATVFFPTERAVLRATGREQVERGFSGVFDDIRSLGIGPPYQDIQPRDMSIQLLDHVALMTFHLVEATLCCRRTLALRQTSEGWKIAHLHASNVHVGYPRNG